MTSEDPVTLTFQGRVAIITLNRPKKLNSLNLEQYYLLGERLREVAQRDDIVITVLTGTGRYFSAGADVTAVGGLGTDTLTDPRVTLVRGFAINNIDLTRAFYTHPKILVVALNGPAVGLSAALIAFADFIYATPHSFLLTPFSSLGLVAEGGSSRAFVERLGISKANEALIMSKKIACEELVSTGFVNRVISAPSGNRDDSVGFLGKVLEEVDERMGNHLNQSSLLRIKKLIREPEKEVLEKQNLAEAYMGVEGFLAGIPQEEFRKVTSGQKRHKL